LSVIIEIGIIGFDPNRFIVVAHGFVVLTKSTMSQASIARLPSHGTKGAYTRSHFQFWHFYSVRHRVAEKARGFIYVDIGNH
jgi:hypothetical protein